MCVYKLYTCVTVSLTEGEMWHSVIGIENHKMDKIQIFCFSCSFNINALEEGMNQVFLMKDILV